MTVVTEQQSGDTKHHQIRQDLQRYLDEVFDLEYDLSGFKFPEKDGFPAYMVGGLPISVAEILDDLAVYFKVKKDTTWDLEGQGQMKRIKSQKRPKGIYVFAHTGSDEPDAQLRNISFDGADTGNRQLMDFPEYLLSTGFHMWKHKTWMDSNTTTTATSSLWFVGLLVCGKYKSVDKMLRFFDGDSEDCYPGRGPREIFLG